MINLLPIENKRQIRAGRVNVVLFRYIIIVVCTFAFLLVALGFTYTVLNGFKASAQVVLNENKTQVQSSDHASAQAQQLAASLTGAKVVFDSDINYTTVLTHIATLIPDGVVIDTLTINATTFGTPQTLQVLAKTNAEATAFQSKLQSSPYFSNVSLQSLSSSSTDSAYPVGAAFTLTINKGIEQ